MTLHRHSRAPVAQALKELEMMERRWFISFQDAIAAWRERGVFRRMASGLLTPMAAHLGFWVDVKVRPVRRWPR